jgi:hypothetical protein
MKFAPLLEEEALKNKSGRRKPEIEPHLPFSPGTQRNDREDKATEENQGRNDQVNIVHQVS